MIELYINSAVKNTCLQSDTRTNKGACPLVNTEMFVVASLINIIQNIMRIYNIKK